MTRKKKVMIWVTVIVVLVGAITALRVSSWNRTFGLSQEVIAGERTPTAEETIRLYFYYSNRRDRDAVEQLLTDHCVHVFSAHTWWEDLELVEIEDAGTWESSDKIEDDDRVWYYFATYNHSIVHALKQETSNSRSYLFILVQEKKNGPWKIKSIGKS